MNRQHPSSLWILSLTETWERYGFYAIQSLLALYLSMHLGLKDVDTYLLVGSFTALTYISPIIGGWIADHLLGQKKSVFIGAIVLLASYLGLAFNNSLHGIIYSLANIAVGTGLLKPNISSLLGRQYPVGDPKRNSGFTFFYMGINLGILFGTTLPSQIQFLWGWKVCFVSASLGLVIALLTFVIGTKILNMPDYAVLQNQRRQWLNYLTAFFVLIGFFSVSYLVLSNNTLSLLFFITVVVLAAGYVIWVAANERNVQRNKTIAFLLLCVISTLFWALYFQMFMALTLFIARSVQPTIMGISFPPPYYIAIQSLGILFFGFILQKYWAKRPSKNIAYSVSIKFSIAILLMLIAYGLILIAIGNPNSLQLISPWLVIVAYLFISLAELMLSPIGLAAVTDLIRPQIVSTMMGIFFVSLGLGGYLSGKLADLTAIDKATHNIILIKKSYFTAFSKLTTILAGAFILSILVVFFIKALMFRHQECVDAYKAG
ncbi:MAG: hypothetical protein A3F10_05725 [Coxiella sp. RIFCSPHIGHO2_12_FULL_42_15]|nr:MAG: hypothetical protein A3F10_05725 [Coxiella sp. RIFCSPHIGHO2_12_FULL_42_15]